jgi:polar amino acid transport system permease protein
MQPAPPRPRLTQLDLALLVAIAAGGAWLAWRIVNLENYRWNWAPIPQYFLRWDSATESWVANILLQGFVTTMRLTLFAMIVATALGFVIGIARVSRDPAIRLIARGYVELMRNTPPLVIIFVIYFFVTSQIVPLIGLEAWVNSLSPGARQVITFLFGDPRLIENFFAGLLCLALFEAAYIAEIVRAGIESIPKGQWEASAALGLHRRQTLRKVILPQAVARTVPPLCNQFVSLVKDSSIVSLVSIQELTFMATDIAVSTQRVYEVWITVAAMYFAVCFALALAFARLERRMARGRV